MEVRWGSLGIFVFFVWACILTIIPIARLLFLSRATALYDVASQAQTQVYLIVMMNLLFALGFGASVYGLWLRQNWGRIVFLSTVSVWCGLNLGALLLPGLVPMSSQSLETNTIISAGAKFAIGLIVTWWYFSLPYVKALFYPQTMVVEE